MKEEASHLTDEFLREACGDLTEAEREAIRTELADEPLIPGLDRRTDAVLRECGTRDQSLTAPPLSDSLRKEFEKARLEAASPEATIYAMPKRYESPPVKRSFLQRLHTPVVVGGGLAVAASLAIAYVTYLRPVVQAIPVIFADAVTLLTPGDETGFLAPIFTWKAENGGVVEVKVKTEDGEPVASLTNAFSPLRWDSLVRESGLEAGERYVVELDNGSGAPVQRSFRILDGAAGAPLPLESLEQIIQQCEGYLADGRPADAWMLWGELNAAQKSDARMQSLKERILKEIEG